MHSRDSVNAHKIPTPRPPGQLYRLGPAHPATQPERILRAQPSKRYSCQRAHLVLESQGRGNGPALSSTQIACHTFFALGDSDEAQYASPEARGNSYYPQCQCATNEAWGPVVTRTGCQCYGVGGDLEITNEARLGGCPAERCDRPFPDPAHITHILFVLCNIAVF